MNQWAAWLRDNGPGRFQLASKYGWDTFVNTAPRADLDVLTRAEMARLSAVELEDYTEARMVWKREPADGEDAPADVGGRGDRAGNGVEPARR